jgi:hypothetical protein
MREKKNELAGSMDAKKGITAFRLTHFPRFLLSIRAFPRHHAIVNFEAPQQLLSA